MANDGFRILIVEDNPHILDMYSYVLRKKLAAELTVPLEVSFAPDGHTALSLLAASPHHLVLTDLYMPVMDGFALVEKIRAQPSMSAIPIVAISAGGQEAKDRALQLGVNVFIRKPVKAEDVLGAVRGQLGL